MCRNLIQHITVIFNFFVNTNIIVISMNCTKKNNIKFLKNYSNECFRVNQIGGSIKLSGYFGKRLALLLNVQ